MIRKLVLGLTILAIATLPLPAWAAWDGGRSGGHETRGNRERFGGHERFERGAHWIRIIGDPVWAGRSEAESIEWLRYESMLNLSFASSPATIMCTYDARSVPDEVLAGARHTHPEVAEAGDVSAGPAYREPEEFLLTLR